jgi:hypothetical protein
MRRFQLVDELVAAEDRDREENRRCEEECGIDER